MTLRLRLVVALVLLVTVGLTVAGVAVYSLFAHSEYQRLDAQIRSSVPLVSQQLRTSGGLDQPSGGGPADNNAGGANNAGRGGNGGRPGPPVVVPGSTYAQLRDSAGKQLGQIALSSSTQRPDLAGLGADDAGRSVTTGSVSGSTEWRVYVSRASSPEGGLLLVASPLSEVTTALHRLVIIEVSTSFAVLALLAIGSWLILRRGLRPLERMSATAGAITAGDLTERVETGNAGTEVDELGRAINTMLDEIETAFRAREATEQRLRQFLADASHELRTPITSIQGFAELYRMGAVEDAGQLALILRRIEEESARMRILVDDLMLLARLDQTRVAVHDRVDVTVLAADACTDAAAVDPDRTLTLDAPESVVILGDEDHVRQALANLVGNAIRHTPAGTGVEVSVRADSTIATIVVRDHGTGLDAEALAHAFDRFWQAAPSRTGPHAGLGLSIVAAIAEEHDGTATAANAPDGGAAFTLRLPLAPTPVRSQTTPIGE